MAEVEQEEFEELRRTFHSLQREHAALERDPFDRAAHVRHRAHLRAYTDALHRWRTGHRFGHDDSGGR